MWTLYHVVWLIFDLHGFASRPGLWVLMLVVLNSIWLLRRVGRRRSGRA